VRWKTCSRATVGWIRGTNWTAEAQSGFGAKENEYRWDGMSQAQPG
jgi:hypothetical protein